MKEQKMASVTLKDVMDLINDVKADMKAENQETRGQIIALRNDFMEMEKGRLTRAERDIAELMASNRIAQSLDQKSNAIWDKVRDTAISALTYGVIMGLLLVLLTYIKTGKVGG